MYKHLETCYNHTIDKYSVNLESTMKLNELAKTDTSAETQADQEWEATLRQHAADGTLAAIAAHVVEEYEDGKTEAL